MAAPENIDLISSMALLHEKLDLVLEWMDSALADESDSEDESYSDSDSVSEVEAPKRKKAQESASADALKSLQQTPGPVSKPKRPKKATAHPAPASEILGCASPATTDTPLPCPVPPESPAQAPDHSAQSPESQASPVLSPKELARQEKAQQRAILKQIAAERKAAEKQAAKEAKQAEKLAAKQAKKAPSPPALPAATPAATSLGSLPA